MALKYDLGPGVEAFSTNIGDAIEFDVVTPAHQAHSTHVVLIPEEADSTYGVDGLITRTPGVCIGVRTADCVPILIYDPTTPAVAAIHSGWKGTCQNIIEKAVDRMKREYGTEPSELRAVIGPCIHQEAFEVGDEVYDAFAQKGYAPFCRRMANPYTAGDEIKWHIDLPGICRKQLMDAGVEQIEVRPECTYAQHERFYSYRRCRIADREHRIYNCIRLV